MDSALAARSTASSFRLTAGPRDPREPPGCYQPSRLMFTRSEPGRTTLRQACPPRRLCSRDRVSEVRTKLVLLIGAQTRVASPSMLASCEIKRRSYDLGAGSLGQVGRPLPGRPCASAHPQQHRLSSLQRSRRGFSKRNNFRSPCFCRNAQRRADKLGRHARCSLSRPSSPFCQGESEEILPVNGPWAFNNQCVAPNRLGISTLTPGPMVEEIATLLM